MNVVPIPVPRNGKAMKRKKNKHHPAQTAQGLQDVPQATAYEGTIGQGDVGTVEDQCYVGKSQLFVAVSEGVYWNGKEGTHSHLQR